MVTMDSESSNGMKLNLVQIRLGWTPFKFVFVDSVSYPRWPPMLIIQLFVFQLYLKFLTFDLPNILELHLNL